MTIIKILKSFIVFMFMLLHINCKDVKFEHEKNTTQKKEKMSWRSSIYSLDYKSDKILNQKDLTNLDRMNGFRLAEFNMNINEFSTDHKLVNINGFLERLTNSTETDYDYLNIEMGSAIADQLNNGMIDSAELHFLKKRLKMIELVYIEGIFNNGIEKINPSKDKNEPANYSEITLFDFYRNVLGEPTKIYTAQRKVTQFSSYRGNFEIATDQSMYQVLKELDSIKEMDVKFIWETQQVYFELYFDSSFDDLFLGTNKYIHEDYKRFKVHITNYIKEKNLLDDIAKGKNDIEKLVNQKDQETHDKENQEKMNTL